MIDKDLRRMTRLTAIMMLLQTRRLTTAAGLSKRFYVSVRTIYRDIRTLEQAGMPILTEEGKGFILMDGYRLPPVMFTETEANALVTARELVLKSRDRSFSEAYEAAVEKISAVLRPVEKAKAELLSGRIAGSPMNRKGMQTSVLSLLGQALTSFHLLKITYRPESAKNETTRLVEPFAFYFSQEEHWLLIAYCRLRKDYRMFRLDRMTAVSMENQTFKPHRLSLPEFLAARENKFRTPDKLLSGS